jgi:histone H2A
MATPSRKSATKKSAKKTSGSKSAKAGLIFPVGRISTMLKKGQYAKRVSGASGCFLAATLEYLTAELLECTAKAVVAAKKNRITPRALTLAVRADKDLGQLFNGVTVSKGGVVPTNVAGKKSKKGKKSAKKVKA